LNISINLSSKLGNANATAVMNRAPIGKEKTGFVVGEMGGIAVGSQPAIGTKIEAKIRFLR